MMMHPVVDEVVDRFARDLRLWAILRVLKIILIAAVVASAIWWLS